MVDEVVLKTDCKFYECHYITMKRLIIYVCKTVWHIVPVSNK